MKLAALTSPLLLIVIACGGSDPAPTTPAADPPPKTAPADFKSFVEANLSGAEWTDDRITVSCSWSRVESPTAESGVVAGAITVVGEFPNEHDVEAHFQLRDGVWQCDDQRSTVKYVTEDQPSRCTVLQQACSGSRAEGLVTTLASIKDAVYRMDVFMVRMCVCADAACAETLQEQFRGWEDRSEQFSKAIDADSKNGPRLRLLLEKYAECHERYAN